MVNVCLGPSMSRTMIYGNKAMPQRGKAAPRAVPVLICIVHAGVRHGSNAFLKDFYAISGRDLYSVALVSLYERLLFPFVLAWDN